MQMSGYERLISRLRTAAIPMFMSEYGTKIPNTRLFQETAALYSPQMSQVFSGGCAYEFWQGSNGYGLVELINQDRDRDKPSWHVEQRREQALARADNPRMTAEKRATGRGALTVFHDFINYKANLDATQGIDSNWEGDIMEREAAERQAISTTQRRRPWEPEFKLPDTVVDWTQLEEEIYGRGLSYVM